MNRNAAIAKRFLRQREEERNLVAKHAGVDPKTAQFRSYPLDKRVRQKKGDK